MHPALLKGCLRLPGAALLLSWGPCGTAVWFQRKHPTRSRVPSLSVLLSVPRSRALAGRAWCRIVAKPGTFLDVPVFPGGLPGGD